MDPQRTEALAKGVFGMIQDDAFTSDDTTITYDDATKEFGISGVARADGGLADVGQVGHDVGR